MKKLVISLISMMLALSVVFTSEAALAFAKEAPAPAPVSVTMQQKADEKKPYTGWKTTKTGRKRYYVNGKVVKNKSKKIGKARYCFTKKGFLVTGRAFKIGKTVYYVANSGKVRAYKRDGVYYKNGGKEMTVAETEDWKTRLTAERIVEEITTDDMSKKEKFKVCFDWVMAKPYVTYRKFYPTDYWPATYANDHFKRRGGDCHADGSAIAYMAVAIGFKNVYVCNDSNGLGAQGHSWCEINGKVYDPLFAQAKSYSKYFGATYGSYGLSPVLHIKMDYNKARPKK